MSTFITNVHLGQKDPLVDSDSIDDGAITTDKIADRAVTNEKLACDSVGSCQIQDGAVTLEKTTGLVPYIDEKIGMEAQARSSALNGLNSRLSQLETEAVKSITVNSGAKKYPDEEGNVNLVISQGGGDESLADQVAQNAEDIAALQGIVGGESSGLVKAVNDNSEDIAALQEAVEGITPKEGEINLPFAGSLSADFTPTIEQVGYADTGGEIMYCPALGCFVLRVPRLLGYDYYNVWNDNGRLSSEEYSDVTSGMYYTTSEDGLVMYHWDDTAQNLVSVSGNGEGGDSPADVEIGENSVTIDGTEVQFKSVNGINIVGTGDIAVEGQTEQRLYDFSDSPIYPENFNAVGDGINFYDWPLVCFGGIEDGVVSVAQQSSLKTVPLPSERLFGDITNIAVDENNGTLVYSLGNLGLSLTAADVVYSTVHHKFLLYYNGTYYPNWKNSDLWNTPDGYPRTDTVYSDISLVAGTTKREAKRISYVWRPTSGSINGHSYSAGLVDIDDLMTDDTEAFYDWLDEAKTGHTLKLQKGKIYYIKPTGAKEYKNVDFKGLEIDFGGAILFVRSANRGRPHEAHWENGIPVSSGNSTLTEETLITLKYVKNLTIKNVTVRALRDRDRGCVEGYNPRLSSSSSRVCVFKLGGHYKYDGTNTSDKFNYNLRFVNIDCRNTIDFDCGAARYYDKNRAIYIDGWKSEGCGMMSVRSQTLRIRNADVTSAPYIGGGGHHMFYFQGIINAEFVNCRFRQPDGFNEWMVDLHETDTVSNTGYRNHLTFSNCIFEACACVNGNNTELTDVVYHGCIFRQINTGFCGSYDLTIEGREYSAKRYSFPGTTSGIVNLSYCHHVFRDCIFYLERIGWLIGSSHTNLVIEGVTVLYGETTDMPIVEREGGGYYNEFPYNVYTQPTGPIVTNISGLPSIKVRDFRTNYTDSIGINVTDYEDVKRGELSVVIDNKIGDINELLTGGYDIVNGDPYFPEVGDTWYNAITNEIRECTVKGERGVFGFYLSWPEDDPPTCSGSATYKVCDREYITFDYENLTLTDRDTFVEARLKELGYVQALSRADLRSDDGITNGQGKFLFATSGGVTYLMIRSKSAGALPPGTRTLNESNVKKIHTSTRPFGSLVTYVDTTHDRDYRVIDGAPFTYSTSNVTGLVQRVGMVEKSTGMVCVPKTWGSLAPSPAAKGDYWYDDVNGLKRHNGTGFVAVDTDGELRVIYNTTNSKLYLAVGGVISKEITLETI